MRGHRHGAESSEGSYVCVGGGRPSLIYLASKTPKRMGMVRAWLFASGAACTAWHLSVWRLVNKAIDADKD